MSQQSLRFESHNTLPLNLRLHDLRVNSLVSRRQFEPRNVVVRHVTGVERVMPAFSLDFNLIAVCGGVGYTF